MTTPLFASAVVIVTAVVSLAIRRFLQDAELAVQAKASDHAARLAAQRAAQLQRMVHFAQVMGTARNIETVRKSLSDTLPALVGSHDFWISTTLNQWDFVVGPGDALPSRDGFPLTLEHSGAWALFPLLVGTDAVGFLAVHQNARAFTPAEKEVLTQIANVVAVSISNAKLFQAARDLSTVDPLTGCTTKRHGFDLFAIEVRRARRSRTAISTVMLDLDQFKALNDEYGHVAGDLALGAIGDLLRQELRASDIRCRFGGEEFLLILPETNLAAAARVAETLRHRISSLEVRHRGRRLPLTASFGVAELPPSDHDMIDYVELADAALYRAKRAGRNCVATSNASGAEVSTPTARGQHGAQSSGGALAS